MEERQLSSRATLWLKVGAPTLWLVPLGLWTVGSIVFDIKNAGLSVIIFLVFGSLCAFWFIPLKKVVATENGLRLSNYLASTTVPYEDVLEVRECKILGHRPVTIVLKHPCRFGRKIRFAPRGQWYPIWWLLRCRDHPVAVWLRETCGLSDAES